MRPVTVVVDLAAAWACRAPLHGEHTDDVLTALGMDPARIADLHASGAVR